MTRPPPVAYATTSTVGHYGHPGRQWASPSPRDYGRLLLPEPAADANRGSGATRASVRKPRRRRRNPRQVTDLPHAADMPPETRFPAPSTRFAAAVGSRPITAPSPRRNCEPIRLVIGPANQPPPRLRRSAEARPVLESRAKAEAGPHVRNGADAGCHARRETDAAHHDGSTRKGREPAAAASRGSGGTRAGVRKPRRRRRNPRQVTDLPHAADMPPETRFPAPSTRFAAVAGSRPINCAIYPDPIRLVPMAAARTPRTRSAFVSSYLRGAPLQIARRPSAAG